MLPEFLIAEIERLGLKHHFWLSKADLYELIQTRESIPTQFLKKESKRVESSCFVGESELNWNWLIAGVN